MIVDVKRSDEPNIRDWLLRKYRKRSLLSEFLP